MEVKVELAPTRLHKDCVCCVWCVIPANLIKVNQRSLFPDIFDEKGWILKHLAKIFAKKSNKNSQQYFLFLKKLKTQFLTILLYFSKIDEILGKNSENVHKNNANRFNIHKILNIVNSLQKTKFIKIFVILYSTPDRLFSDTTHNSIRWIYLSVKIDWTKKPIWEYSSSPLKKGSEQKNQENALWFNYEILKYLKKFINDSPRIH